MFIFVHDKYVSSLQSVLLEVNGYQASFSFSAFSIPGFKAYFLLVKIRGNFF